MDERIPFIVGGTEFYVERGGLVGPNRQWTDEVDTLYVVTERGDERVGTITAGDMARAEQAAEFVARGLRG